MSRSTLRAIIVITGLITALVHLVVLNMSLGKVDVLFTLNGLGYLALLAAFLWNPGPVAERRKLLHWAFMAYTAVTILAWVAVGSRDLVGYLTKLDELILLAALWMNMGQEEPKEAGQPPATPMAESDM